MTRMKTSNLSAIACLLLASTTFAQDEGKPRREGEIRELMQNAEKAKAAGKMDEARELAEKARQLHGEGPRRGEGAQRPAIKRDGAMNERLANVKREIEELHRAGKHDEANKLRQSIEKHMRGEHREAQGEKSRQSEGPAKLRHLAEAIRNLREAGLPEEAARLEPIAKKMHAEFEAQHRAQQQPPHEGPARRPGNAGPGPDQMHALQEQLQKMSRSIEELQTQVRKLGGAEEVRRGTPPPPSR